MTPGSSEQPAAIGFLTVVEHASGLFGGYLVLNTAGRPLEFHCTAPVKPNRAQEILYGPTLRPYLYGEQIGHTLVAKATLQPLVICTDLEPVLALRDHVSIPVGLVLTPPDEDAAASDDAPILRLDTAHGGVGAPFALGRNRVAVGTAHDEDRHAITERLDRIAEAFDLAEPFARIREAIDEAQRTGR